MRNLIRTATMLAFASFVALPTAPMAASLDGSTFAPPAMFQTVGSRHGGGHHHNGGHNHHGGDWGGFSPFWGIGAGMLGFGLGSAWAYDRFYNYDYGDYDDGYVLNGHAARCAARYQSYDVRRDAFLGYDGYWHRCRL